MTAETPIGTPASLIIGDTLKFKVYVKDYLPSDSWVLSYAFVKTGAQETATGSDNGDGYHLIEVAAATTATWTAGTYNWQSYVTKGSERYQVCAGTIEFLPNFAVEAGGYDDRSEWETIRDNLLAAYQTLSSGGGTIAEVRIEGVWTKYRSAEDILPILKYAESKVAQEQAAARLACGKASGNLVKVHF